MAGAERAAAETHRVINQKKKIMATQRHSYKKQLRTWIFEKDINFLRQSAEEAEMPLSEFLLEITKQYESYIRKKPKLPANVLSRHHQDDGDYDVEQNDEL